MTSTPLVLPVRLRFAHPEQARPWLFQEGHKTWTAGTGGCKRGHATEMYRRLPSGVRCCFACKRENAARYRANTKGKRAWQRRLQPYGMTVVALDAIFNSQEGACAICRRAFIGGNYHIDHDHKTRKVRGLLCASCNTGIGLFRDSPEALANAARYLNGNGC